MTLSVYRYGYNFDDLSKRQVVQNAADTTASHCWSIPQADVRRADSRLRGPSQPQPIIAADHIGSDQVRRRHKNPTFRGSI